MGLQGRDRRKTPSLSLPRGCPGFWVAGQAFGCPAPTRCEAAWKLRGPFVPYLLCLLGGSIQINIPFGAEIPARLPTSPPGGLRAASCTLSPGPPPPSAHCDPHPPPFGQAET